MDSEEATPLVSAPTTAERRNPRRAIRRIVVVGSALVFVAVGIAGMNGTKHWGQSNFRAETIETGGTDLSSVLDVKAENKYTAAHGHAGRGYPWLKEGRRDVQAQLQPIKPGRALFQDAEKR